MWTTTQIAGQILYAHLGHGGARVTMKGLINPQTSVVAQSQQQLVHLMADWSEEAGGWVLLARLRPPFDDRNLRLMAREQCLKMHSGNFEYFELRLSGLPHCLIRMCFEFTTAQKASQLVDKLLSEPFQCLSDSCQRLRSFYQTRSALLMALPKAMGALGQHLVCGIDASERAHGAMRGDLKADARASNFSTYCCRVHCRQMQAAHEAIGGAPEPPIPSLGSRTRKDEGSARKLAHGHNGSS